MDPSLQSHRMGRIARKGCLALALTTTSWILAGCDPQPATQTVRDEIVTADFEPSHTIRLTESNFDREVLHSKQTVLVDFWAVWCTPCLEMAPAIEELAAEFEGRAVIGKVNVDTQPDIAKRYRVDAVPAILLFRNGEFVTRLDGSHTKEELELGMNELINAR